MTSSPGISSTFLPSRGQPTVLGRLTNSGTETTPLTPLQSQVDGLITNFIHEATHPTTLASIAAGSMAYRATRLGVMALGVRNSVYLGTLVRPLSIGLGLGTEVTAFEFTHRVLQSVGAQGRAPLQENPNLWSWSGRGGWAQGLTSSLVTFGMLKGAGHLSRETNLIFQHAFSSTAMVAGHNTAAVLGALPRPEGSLAEQFLHAEATNLQLGAGTGLLHRLAPGIHAFERSLDLSLQATQSARPYRGLLMTQLALATAGKGGRGLAPSHESLADPLRKNPLAMMSQTQGENGGTREKTIDRHLDQIARPDLEEARRDPPPVSQEPGEPVRRIGLLTSGGDGPGENSAIQALVEGILLTHRGQNWQVFGIREGFLGLLQPEGRIFPLTTQSVFGDGSAEALRKIYGVNYRPRTGLASFGFEALGGNILKSSRTNPLEGDPNAERVKRTLHEYGLDALIVMGGNGSMGATLDLARQGIKTVFMPQTIDNDVSGTEISLGFPSAVAKGVQMVRDLYHTSHSCNRWFLVEVMGRHSGALSLSIAREAGADGVFIGESPRPLWELKGLIERRKNEGQHHGVILVAEGARFLDDQGRLIGPKGLEDPKNLREIKGGEISRWLSQVLGINHTRTETLSYQLRGAPPTSHEISLAQTLSLGALQLIAAGHFGRMVGLRYSDGRLDLHFPPLESLVGQKNIFPTEYYEQVRRSLNMEVEEYSPSALSPRGTLLKMREASRGWEILSEIPDSSHEGTRRSWIIGDYSEILKDLSGFIDSSLPPNIVHRSIELIQHQPLSSNERFSFRRSRRVEGSSKDRVFVALRRELVDPEGKVWVSAQTGLVLGAGLVDVIPPNYGREATLALPPPVRRVRITPEIMKSSLNQNGEDNPLHASQEEAIRRGLPGRHLSEMALLGLTETAFLQSGPSIDLTQPLRLALQFHGTVREDDTVSFHVKPQEKGYHLTVLNQRYELILSGNLQHEKYPMPALDDLEIHGQELARLVAEFSREVERQGDQEIPPYPLPENERAMISTGYLHTPPRSATTMEEMESLYRSDFLDSPISVTDSQDPAGKPHRTLQIGSAEDHLRVDLREFEYEGRRLLHVERSHVQGDRIIPIEEEVRPLRFPSEEAPRDGRNEGSTVPRGALISALRKMLEEIPPTPSLFSSQLKEHDHPSFLLLEGTLRHHRLEALHRLLSEGRNLKGQVVIDNAPGTLFDLALSLARMGASVTVKEPGQDEREASETALRFMTPREVQNLIHFVPAESIDKPTPGEVVYWSHPDPRSLQIPYGVSLENYLSRDVQPGGYLVIQTDHAKGIHEEFRRLQFNPHEWELIFREDLPDLGRESNAVLPTLQTQGLHLQIYRRFPIDTSVGSGVGGNKVNGSPYILDSEGRYRISAPSQKVVILGDTPGVRTAELALQGHKVVHIERDSDYLESAKTTLQSKIEQAKKDGTLNHDPQVTFLKLDWNLVPDQADYVEGFYPLDFHEVPRDNPNREDVLRIFLSRALNSKLKAGGIGFMVSEYNDIIEDLSQVIEKDPHLELLETHSDSIRPPIVGGFGTLAGISTIRHYWLVYRKKSP